MALYQIVASGYTNGSVSEVTTRDGFNLEKASGPDRFLGQFNAFGAWQFNTPSDSRAQHKIKLSATVSSGNSIRVYFNVPSSGTGVVHIFQVTDAGSYTLGQADDFTFIDSTYTSGSCTVTGDGSTYNTIEVDGSNASQVTVLVNGVAVLTNQALTNAGTALYGGFLLGSGGEAEYFQIGEASAAARLRPPLVANRTAVRRASVY